MWNTSIMLQNRYPKMEAKFLETFENVSSYSLYFPKDYFSFILMFICRIVTPTPYVTNKLKRNIFSCNMCLYKTFMVKYCNLANMQNNFTLFLSVSSFYSHRLGVVQLFCF